MSNPASKLSSSMPARAIGRLSALAEVAAQNPVKGSMTLTSMGEGLVVHALGFNTQKSSLARLQKLASDEALSLRDSSVDQWFLVGEKSYDASELTEMTNRLTPDFFLSDQSAGRVRLQIEGGSVEHVLNKGIALDLSLSAFPLGKSTSTLCGHIGVHMTRLGEALFELMVLRSFSVTLWEELAEMCAPHLHKN